MKPLVPDTPDNAVVNMRLPEVALLPKPVDIWTDPPSTFAAELFPPMIDIWPPRDPPAPPEIKTGPPIVPPIPPEMSI
jgi:hypothetical protein